MTASVESPEGDIITRLMEHQPRLRKEISTILNNYQRVGIYSGEPPDLFPLFYTKLNELFEKVEGERGVVSQKIRESLLSRTDIDLSLIESDPTTHIRLIWHRLRDLNRGETGVRYERLIEAVRKTERTNNLISQGGDLSEKIIRGLRAKGKLQGDGTEQLEEIRAARQAVLEIKREELRLAKLDADECPYYQACLRLSAQLEPYLEVWRKVDIAMGLRANAAGLCFEKSSEKYGAPLVAKLMGLENWTVWRSAHWVGTPGEIDLVLEVDGVIEALVECKSRPFDLEAGWRQSGPPRSAAKTHVRLPDTRVLPAPRSRASCFVLTVLPPHPYLLGMPSGALQAGRKAVEHEMPVEEAYTHILGKAGGEDVYDPRDWIKQHEDRVLVLDLGLRPVIDSHIDVDALLAEIAAIHLEGSDDLGA
eukprot:gnl/Dysnectes_brevis/528_a585_2770.p1 GENE.gnl/Dysnectes_brevis/528_a585_2770~~gnl/Dysnectes_brevis/528_a585_2770.p1  ORF type:complete len:421 (-),score=133.39 gnl/Dysnectes_brevis/528_a585_2770:65-1327(-)